jgi:hypothetical protein
MTEAKLVERRPEPPPPRSFTEEESLVTSAPAIVVKSYTAAEMFLEGRIVFRITSASVKEPNIVRDKGMVTTVKDYENLCTSETYSPIVFIAPLVYRLAYLYGCLNLRRAEPRSEIFIFWYRVLNHREWHEWFVVNPYVD